MEKKTYTPSKEALGSFKQVRPLPKRFTHRGDIFVTEKLTAEQVETLAKDKKFQAFQAPAKEEKPNSVAPAKKTDDAK